MKLSKNIIIDKLKSVLDPELGVSIVDLGLIYDVFIENKNVRVKMTLTTIGCPLFSLIADQVKGTVKQFEGIDNVEVELTFDPPWDPDKMSEDAKISLGFI